MVGAGEGLSDKMGWSGDCGLWLHLLCTTSHNLDPLPRGPRDITWETATKVHRVLEATT
jgi:hypothetical protein